MRNALIRMVMAIVAVISLATLVGGCELYLGDDQIVTDQPGGGAEVAPPEIWSPTDPAPGQHARIAHTDLFPIVGYCVQAPCRLWADGRPTTGGAWAITPHPTFKVIVEEGVAAANGGEVINKSGQFVVAASGLVPGWWTVLVGQGEVAVQSAPSTWSVSVLRDAVTFEVYDLPQ